MNVGTSLPVETTADRWAVVVGGMGAPVKPREKAAPTGEQTHSSGCILMVQRKDGSVQPDKTASVHVLKPATVYEFGTFYEARGRVWVQPYESNERMALSITVEQLVPIGSDAGSTSTPAAGKSARSASKEEAA
ncbi:hypothetical protein MU582_03360 [Nocardioidaceae bacterium SCSIO 66511]|nr:hypothetical protein MU582_03360 [Nocardioidaceae bacterium SCSIO 66511]